MRAPRDKSVGASLVLTFLFGPFGLLYASVVGGLVMIFVWFVVGLVTLGIGLLVLWPDDGVGRRVGLEPAHRVPAVDAGPAGPGSATSGTATSASTGSGAAVVTRLLLGN